MRRDRPLPSLDVMCTGHQAEITMPGGVPVQGMQQFTAAVREGRVAKVEFGPTTILQVPRSVALQYVKVRRWDAGCGEMPPLNAAAAKALERYVARRSSNDSLAWDPRPGRDYLFLFLTGRVGP